MNVPSEGLTAEEIGELVALVKNVHDFDFSDYTKASLKRRLTRIMMIRKMSFGDLKQKLTGNQLFFREFLEEITVNVTGMFRDPSFYQALSNQVLPHLAALQQIKIWSAGCSTGEEVYSLAILMHQAGILDDSMIYGTDINTSVLTAARRGIYSERNIKIYEENYRLTGLGGSFPAYFTATKETSSINNNIKSKTLFFTQNLISGAIFDQFQLISCRNVFIYFETQLQEKILNLFYDSLHPNGFLCLGSKETIRSDKFKTKFISVNQKENIYRKMG